MTSRLTSTRNERVRATAALARRRDRHAAGHHLVEGPHAVGHALAAGVITTVFVATAHGEDPHAVLRAHLPGGVATGVEVVAVADHVLAHLADTRTPQGVVAVAVDPTVGLDAVPTDGLMVVLDRLADPGNVGGIVRTADAAGVAAVVCLEGTSDPLGPKAVRAGAGSTYHVPLVVGVGVDELLDHARATGRRLWGLDGDASRSVLDLGLADHPMGLVLGSEAHGLDAAFAERLDGRVAVPMVGRAESLNVAVAAGVAIYAAAVGLAGPTSSAATLQAGGDRMPRTSPADH